MLHGNRIITIRIHGITGIMKTMKGKRTMMMKSTMIKRENIKLAFKGNI